MDSQNPFFLNNLQDKEQGFESFDSSILMVHSAFRRECPSISTPSWNGTIYTLHCKKNQLLREVNEESTSLVDEDINLVSAWLNVSLDAAVTLTNQKHTTFWERIWFTFHNDKKFNRTRDSLNSRGQQFKGRPTSFVDAWPKLRTGMKVVKLSMTRYFNSTSNIYCTSKHF